jgi:hypothetical protein
LSEARAGRWIVSPASLMSFACFCAAIAATSSSV